MLSCRACLSRCIRALDTAVPGDAPLRRNATPLILSTQRRSYETSASPVRRLVSHAAHGRTAQGRTSAAPYRRSDSSAAPYKRSDSDASPYKSSGLKPDTWAGSRQATRSKAQERKALTRPPGASEGKPGPLTFAPRRIGLRDADVPVQSWNRRRKELQHLTDPLELADFVKKELVKDKEEEMLQLVRMASHSLQCIVSWNHIIDHTLSKGKVTNALKIYNEMKKRAQFPDAYTYSILLRGMSNNAEHPVVLGKALSLYHSMSAENSRVQPSIIHTNSVLRVCARSNDMDALWGVAAQIPDKGPASANGITYVTILNAIRQSILVGVPIGESDLEVAARRERGIIEARRVWEEIIGKWRSGDLIIGEELVCAMGRILMVGAMPRDWDDVLSLVEQTMDIPRLVPRLGTPERKKAGYPPLRAPHVPEQYRSDDSHLSPAEVPVRGDEFLSIIQEKKRGNPLTYATPSNSTLSLILEACQKVVANKAADEYWNLLTDPGTYGIRPDLNNFNFRLRLLRQYRSSATAMKVITEMSESLDEDLRPGTFRIAMSTCMRDKNNHNSLKNASQILDIMMKTFADADPKTVAMYAKLALSMPLATGPGLVEALARLDPVIKNIRLQLGVGLQEDEGRGRYAAPLIGEKREEAIVALDACYGVHDKLIQSNMISEAEKTPYKAKRSVLAVFRNRMNYQDAQKEIADKQAKYLAEKEKKETPQESKEEVLAHIERIERGIDVLAEAEEMRLAARSRRS